MEVKPWLQADKQEHTYTHRQCLSPNFTLAVWCVRICEISFFLFRNPDISTIWYMISFPSSRLTSSIIDLSVALTQRTPILSFFSIKFILEPWCTVLKLLWMTKCSAIKFVKLPPPVSQGCISRDNRDVCHVSHTERCCSYLTVFTWIIPTSKWTSWKRSDLTVSHMAETCLTHAQTHTQSLLQGILAHRAHTLVFSLCCGKIQLLQRAHFHYSYHRYYNYLLI